MTAEAQRHTIIVTETQSLSNLDRLPRSCSSQMEKYLSVKGEIFMTVLGSEPMSFRGG
ncbi:mCG146844 [Mus musculus]|jgi:hypothetical protein|nr:mCG146844 [Mus musculus]